MTFQYFLEEQKLKQIINQFEKINNIVVVGDVGVDKYTEGLVNRISPEAPVPVLEVKKEWPKLGLAANVSHNLVSLGINNFLCGVVGEDFNSKVFFDLMDELKLSHTAIVKEQNRHTTFKERITTTQQQICRVDYESTHPISDETEKKILNNLESLKQDLPAIIVEDYAKGLFTQKLLQNIIKFAHENKILVTVDPSRMTHPLFYKGADLIKPNWVEAMKMVELLGYKENKLENIVNLLLDKLNLEKLVVTLGAEGMASIDLKHKDANKVGKIQMIPTVASEVYDVSGAGDTVISVITAGLVAGADLDEACFVANCAAGVVVGKRGTATVDIQEIEEIYQKVKKQHLQK